MIRIIGALIIAGLSMAGCKKMDEWLEVKNNKTDVMPASLSDYQAIMDNTNSFNGSQPVFGLVATDNLYVPDANFGSLTEDERNAYLFRLKGYQHLTHAAFSSPYLNITADNLILEGIAKGYSGSSADLNNVKGQALFHRCNMFYHLAQLFCRPYDAATAASDPGIQLRLTTDPNSITPRSTVAQTYARIIADLELAIDLLPATQQYVTRPSRVAALALLAKVYLSMEDYAQAGLRAGQALAQTDTLLNYNNPVIQPSGTFRFPAYSNLGFNPEVIFYAAGQSYVSLWPSYNVSYVDSTLYRSYHADDLRRKLLYAADAQGRARFTGSYTGTYYQFTGIATNELYLVSAECKVRTGDVPGALADLNRLLQARWNGSAVFAPLTANTPEKALQLVLTERRKELPFTGQLRWEDLRRLNKDPRFATTVMHYNNGTRFQLPPGDKRYVLPIPEQEISISGIDQNEQ